MHFISSYFGFMPLQFHCIIFCFLFFRFHLTHDLVSGLVFLSTFCLWDLFVGIWGLSSNPIFSCILYLLLDSGVSFKVFVSYLCLDWDRWRGMSWCFDLGNDCLCWVLSLCVGYGFHTARLFSWRSWWSWF